MGKGRPKSTKNTKYHQAGGARKGSGRKPNFNEKGPFWPLLHLAMFGRIVLSILLCAQCVKNAMAMHSFNVICANSGHTKIACLIFTILK